MSLRAGLPHPARLSLRKMVNLHENLYIVDNSACMGWKDGATLGWFFQLENLETFAQMQRVAE